MPVPIVRASIRMQRMHVRNGLSPATVPIVRDSIRMQRTRSVRNGRTTTTVPTIRTVPIARASMPIMPMANVRSVPTIRTVLIVPDIIIMRTVSVRSVRTVRTALIVPGIIIIMRTASVRSSVPTTRNVRPMAMPTVPCARATRTKASVRNARMAIRGVPASTPTTAVAATVLMATISVAARRGMIPMPSIARRSRLSTRSSSSIPTSLSA